MAVPTLAAMAALTLLQHPEHQPEGVSVDYTPFRAPAITIQRMARGVLARLRRNARLLFDWRLQRRYMASLQVYMPYRQDEINKQNKGT